MPMTEYYFTEEESKANERKDAEIFLAAFTTHIRESVESDRRQQLDWHDHRNPSVEEFKEDVNRAVEWALEEAAQKLAKLVREGIKIG